MTDLEKRAEEYADTKVKDRKGYNARWELVREAYIKGAEENTALLSQHILELQKTNGALTDRVSEATEIIGSLRTCLLDFDEDTIEPYKQYIDKAEAFLGDVSDA